jgi:hypothetical protein
MNAKHQDQIIDIGLAEILAGQKPPDLSQKILAALAAGPRAETVEPPVNGHGTVSPVAISAPSKSPVTRRPAWLSVAVAAGVLAVIVAYGTLKPPGQLPVEPGPGQVGQRSPNDQNRTPRLQNDGPRVASSNIENPSPGRSHDLPVEAPRPEAADHRPVPPLAENIATSQPPRTENATPGQPGDDNRTARSLPRSSRTDDEIIAAINGHIRRRWQEHGVKPAAHATDSEWVRRVYLDVLGRIPTIEETNRFVADRSPKKKAHLLDELLGSDRGAEEFARNWANIWSTLLLGRGQQPGSLANRDGLHQYLRRAFLRNKPYDEFVAELVNAEGANTPGEEGYHGAVNFLLDNLQDNAAAATSKTARIFLGVQVQCTQCHNHPFNDTRQSQFWDLNSFFRQAKGVRNRGDEVARLVDVDFPGEGGNHIDEAEIYWEQRNGLLKVSYPVFIDGTAINPSGAVAKVNRRDELARLITRSPQLPQALVNRLWGHFLGYGFTRPVDDMGPHNPPSHPDLLAELADDFAATGFDYRRLIRWIALSEPYALSSRMPKESKDDPAAGQAPLFSYFYLRQMRAEELYESLLVATGSHGTLGNYDQQQRTKSAWLEQFAMVYQTDENDEATTFNGAITQTLMMFNGDLIKRATSGETGSLLYEVAMSNEKPAAKVNRLFTAALSRKPTPQELQKADELWRQHQGDTQAALADLWWAVLNSNEFIFNH